MYKKFIKSNVQTKKTRVSFECNLYVQGWLSVWYIGFIYEIILDDLLNMNYYYYYYYYYFAEKMVFRNVRNGLSRVMDE